ncbi:MAG TPA: putative F420-0 ABC transporter substrate-binding protein [Microbacterium sp.]|uniref:putative F420-0 ABC transporter substrate-binding protein n=1 Tax=Microbacterium sp. TaxID=51671 RepID=UPI000EB86F81|nr:putative F420-0 ABC transporter substrate-binding protein [Microbacterium sp.]
MPAPRQRLIAASALLIAAFAFVGCTSTAEATPETAPAAAGYPVTVDNCGTDVTFDAAPERVLAIKSSSIEMMLALGLEDRMIGTAFPDGEYAEQWAERGTDVPLISEKVPGQEATLSLEPDLVYAGWESNVTADGAGDRETLASLGVNTFVSPSACQEPEYQPDPLTFDDVFAEIEQVGTIFDAQDAATDLVADLQSRLDAVTPDDRGLTALWFSSGSDTPFVGAGIGAPQMMMDAAGLTNIAEDMDETWSSLSWEVVVDANPDVIVLVDSAWGSTVKKIGVLEANPATASLPAVVNSRYLVVPFPAGEAGVRNVEAVESLIAQLKEIAPQ